MTSVNSLLNALQKGDNVRDYQHAARTFVDNGYELQPRHSNLFHVVFSFTPDAAQLFSGIDKLEIPLLVKTIDLPSFSIDVQTHNQYNRQVQTHHKINYNPINIAFHDDNKDLIRQLWNNYYQFYFSDSHYAVGGAQYTTNDRYGFRPGEQWGLNSGRQRFFKDVKIYSMLQKRFAEYTLINPMITSFGHDNHAYANGSLMQHTMQMTYETVKYATGFVNNINPRGFGEIHYDTTPSPIGIHGDGGKNSVFFAGGILDAANTIANDLFNGNVLGAIVKGGILFNNTRDVDFGEVLKKDAQRAVGSILRGDNPLNDIVIPNVVLDGLSAIGLDLGNTNNVAPVTGLNPNNVRSNGNFISDILFGTPSSNTDINRGNGRVIPNGVTSPTNPRRLSDARPVIQGELPTNTRANKIRELQDRLNTLNTQIQDTINNNLGAVNQGVPEFLLRERNDLRRRLQEETNQPVPAGPSPSIAI